MSQMCDVAEEEPIKSGYTKAWINDQFKRKNIKVNDKPASLSLVHLDMPLCFGLKTLIFFAALYTAIQYMRRAILGKTQVKYCILQSWIHKLET